MPRSATTLVLLSYNEYDALKALLPRIPLDDFEHVFAVDPGSTDGTLDLYRQAGIRTIVQEQRGRGRAFIEAQTHVTTEHVVFYSVDGNEDPRDLQRIVAYLEEGYDLVIAGRYHLAGSGTDDSDDPFRLRRRLAILGGRVANVVWRTGVWDAVNGFRGFKLEAMRRLRLSAQGHEIEFQSTIRAAKLGLRIKEFGTSEQPRLAGTHRPTANTTTLIRRLVTLFVMELVRGRRF